MADEVRNANVIRIDRDGDEWAAVIGPDAQSGLVGHGVNPVSAVLHLLFECVRKRWCFDASWRPGKTRFHDA